MEEGSGKTFMISKRRCLCKALARHFPTLDSVPSIREPLYSIHAAQPPVVSHRTGTSPTPV